MSQDHLASPLLVAALALIGDEATADQLRERIAQSGARLDDGVADAILDELAGLGLVRVTRTDAAGRHFVVTSVGQRRLDDTFAGQRNESERLAELEQLRTDLLSTIAHELRTPLTAIRTSVGLLQDDGHAPNAEQRATLLATIDRNALRMQRVVGEILDLARFRAGSIQLQLRRFDAREMASAAIASVEPLAAHAQQHVSLAAPGTPTWVFGDYRRLEQALVNLLSNAVKFSARDAPIEVSVDTLNDGRDVRWTVIDKGPGISAADQERLFERFFVGRNDVGGDTRGVGLGLPTVLAIAQAHGGRVDVDSTVGQGSTFAIVVPAEGPQEVDEEGR